MNLLRNSRVNPNLSAWAYLFGNFNFNRHPLAPPGTKVIVHTKKDDRKSWEYRGKEGFYVGPSMPNYRCVKCYMPQTRSMRITDTLTLVPHQIPIPNPSLEDHIKSTSKDLLLLLANKKKPIGPMISDTTKQQMLKLAQLLAQDQT